MAKTVLAFDFGASNGRAMLGEYENGFLSMKEVHRFPNDPVTVGNTMYWDILRLWHEVKTAFHRVSASGVRIDAVGIDCWGVDFGLLDAKGDLIANPVHYRDRRTIGIPERVFQTVSKSALYARTGIQLLHFNTLYQLYYLAHDRADIMERAETMLFIPDLFAYFLTGEKRAEVTVASTSNFLDPYTRTWDKELLDTLGIPTRILPDIIQSGESYGCIQADLANELGCGQIPVIAVCTHDTGSAVAAAPAHDDFAYISCGTWSLFGTELSSPCITPASEEVQYTNELGFGSTVRFLKNIMGLWLIQESRRQWIREGCDVSYADLEREALGVEPFVSFIDCDAPEFETAGDLPARVQDFCRATGQKVPETRGEIMRCIYQSIAMKYKKNFQTLCSLTGKEYPGIYMLGGGIKDTLLCRMTASATGATVFAGPAEATVMGNIAVQMISLGELKDLRDARDAVRRSVDPAVYTPDEAAVWGSHYARYCSYLGKSAL